MLKTIFFHEDDYRQIEIIPAENYGFCKTQMGDIERFADNHLVENGSGYTDIFLRGENPVPLTEKNVSAIDLDRMLKSVLPPIKKVYTGYGSFKTKCKHISAYGDHTGIVIFFDKKGEYVANIWIDLAVCNESDIHTTLNVLRTISGLGEFILADWSSDFVGQIDNTNTIREYLKEQLHDFTDANS